MNLHEYTFPRMLMEQMKLHDCVIYSSFLQGINIQPKHLFFLLLSDCSSFWMEKGVRATMKLPRTGNFTWTFNHIPNGENIIDNNSPCIHIDPDPEPYIKYSKLT